MVAKYSYFEWEMAPCRVVMEEGNHRHAEMYRAGSGFVPAPLSSLLSDGRPISKREFDQMILARVMDGKQDDSERL